jgi:hypothetical protein
MFVILGSPKIFLWNSRMEFFAYFFVTLRRIPENFKTNRNDYSPLESGPVIRKGVEKKLNLVVVLFPLDI